ncbi:hypothetical protein ACFE04_003238 [Oxalis oulophora]
MAAQPVSNTTATASLYVGDLHPDVNDGHLFDVFAEYKSVVSVRVVRDSATGRSLCYGYVNFVNPKEAHHAVEFMNNKPILGKMMRVMWSHRDSDARKSGIGNVFVKNLSESINNTGLQEMFRKFGNVVSCKVATFEDGKSKGYGFVQFESEESALAAIDKLNGFIVGDKEMYVGKFIRKSDRVMPSPDVKYTNLYIKNLDPDVTEDELLAKFLEFGIVASLAISKDSNGSSRGFGFVNFDNPDDAKRAIEMMNGLQFGSKILYVGRAQKKAEREEILRRQFEEKRQEQIQKYRGSNVYVKNIDDDVTDEQLKEYFGTCGTITSAKLMRDDKGISKGFGFVCYTTPEEASKAVSNLHGHMFHRKPLYVAIAQRKEERQGQLQIQYAQRMAGLVAGQAAAVIPGAYPPLYYTAPTAVVSPVAPRPGLMYQSMGLRPGWRGNGFAPPPRPAYQPSPLPVIPNAPRQQHRQNRGRMNGIPPQGNVPHSVSYVPHMQPTTPMAPAKDMNTQQRVGQGTNYVPNGRPREISKGSGVSSTGSNSVSQTETLSSMLAAASPDQQKQILGEQLYPQVLKLKPDLVAKITGMLLEMDNAELLLLLESPESLAAKVEEAVQVLKISKTKVSGQDVIHSNFLSAEVAVN